MKVIICGAGQVGWQIARHLASENDVTIVDSDQDLVSRATDTLDVKGAVDLHRTQTFLVVRVQRTPT